MNSMEFARLAHKPVNEAIDYFAGLEKSSIPAFVVINVLGVRMDITEAIWNRKKKTRRI